MRFVVPAVACFVMSAAAEPVTNPTALRSWARAAKTRRADVVMLGDSNQLYQGYGWNGGYIASFRSACGLYATGLLWCGEGEGNGMADGEGYGTTVVGSSGPFGFTTAPAPLDRLVTFRSQISQYLHLDQGSITGARNMGFRIEGALDPSASLRWWLTDATFPTHGSYQPMIRLGNAPYTTLASFGQVDTGGGYGLRTTAFTLPAGARSGPIEFRYAPYSFSPVMQGPLLMLWNRCEQVDRPGVSVHTLFAWGGKSARWMAESIGTASDEFITAYFSEVRRLQSGDVRVLVRISQGLNDSSETLPSHRQGILPGNSPAAFIDNVDFTIARITDIWSINRWPVDELSFILSVGHAVNGPTESDQQLLNQYAAAAVRLTTSRRNLAVVHLSELLSSDQMRARAYYATGSSGVPVSAYHLSRAGYVDLSAFEVTTILRQDCVADFNQDGGVDGSDIESFFREWENAGSVADVSEDGVVDGADVEAFFIQWESEC